MSKALLYREFRRRVVLATAALFAVGVFAALVLGASNNVWVIVEWLAISSPILVVVAICVLAPLEHMAVKLGLSQGGAFPHLRPTVVFWIIVSIALPWIAAWLVADLSGYWFETWQLGKGVEGGGIYLWAVRLLAGATTYSLAGALGLVLTYFFDSTLDDESVRKGG